MAIHPLTHANGSTDKRYAIALEFCGFADQRYVLRFCGDYIGAFLCIPSATLRAINHKNPNPAIVAA